MPRKKKATKACCTPAVGVTSCCSVESVVTIDERGQMVLPKEIRRKAGIRAGDKLAVIHCGDKGKMSCIMLIKADELREMVKARLGPAMMELFGE